MMISMMTMSSKTRGGKGRGNYFDDSTAERVKISIMVGI